MWIGLLYFLVIVLANTIGAISGMGGGVIIKPIFDLIGIHSVAAISFYAAVAVFVMAFVSTYRQIQNGIQIQWKVAGWISFGAVVGGVLGSQALNQLLTLFSNEDWVTMIQIVLTVLTLLFAFFYSYFDWRSFRLNRVWWYLFCGLTLGFLASLLGIGGGPINVSLLVLLFSMPIKEATVYSICTIFFSQLAKLVTIFLTTGYSVYDRSVLPYIIVAAMLGGFLGARFSGILSPKKVTLVFQAVILLVLLVNIYNGVMLFI
ncbi:sulfite exporter TauE/SafE family protein [Enterococcus sp. LJL98]